MILNIDEGVNRYYVQTLCMVFFPGAKFSQDEVADQNTPQVTVKLSDNSDSVTAFVTISVSELSVTAEHTESKHQDIIRISPEKKAIGAAFYKAGERLFQYTPSWGILTGVRPTKIAMDLIKKGFATNEIRKAITKQYFLNPKKASLMIAVAQNEMKIIDNLQPKTCSIYISIPFCPTRCNYCSFVSYSTKRLLSLIPDYLQKLYVDIDFVFKKVKELGYKVSTIYIGGGTPSILTCAQITQLLKKINRHVDPDSLLEYTFEAGRPDTITSEKLAILYEHGITRICINPQTLNDSILENIGRSHTSADFYKAFEIARKSKIKCINTDLIAGLPGESFASFSRSVDAVIGLKPENVTFHTFCVKKSAEILQIEHERIYARSDTRAGKCVDYSQLEAKNAGYLPYYMYRQKNTVGNYENVGFSLEGYEGLYNVFMMEELHSIFGIGAGSVTKMVSDDGLRIKRCSMPKYPYEFLDPEKHDKCVGDICTKLDDFFNIDRN